LPGQVGWFAAKFGAAGQSLALSLDQFDSLGHVEGLGH